MNDLIQLKTRDEVLSAEAAAQAALNRDYSSPVQDALDTYVDDQFKRNREHRKQAGTDDAITACLRAAASEYSPEKLAELREIGSSEVFLGLTGVKCRAAIAWLMEIFAADGDKVWGLRPTPDPEISPHDQSVLVQAAQRRMQELIAQAQQAAAQEAQQAQQEFDPQSIMTPEFMDSLRMRMVDELKDAIIKRASEKAEKMETRIHDQMTEGGWADVFSDIVHDLVCNKAAIVKGPVVRMRRKKRWTVDPFTGQSVMAVSREPVVTFDRVAPFDAFPSPQAVDFKSDFIERYRMTRAALAEVRDMEGYNPLEIIAVLEEFDTLAAPSMTAEDRTRAELEGKQTSEADQTKDSVEAIEAWVAVPGAILKESGIQETPEGEPLDDYEAYDVTVIKIGTHRIFFDFCTDPLKRKPYSKSGWSKVPGSFWYRSVPELMVELQVLVNASMRSLANNMVIAAGPQVSINDVARLVDGEEVTSIFPGKIWQFKNRMNNTGNPLTFFQPQSNAGELLAVYDKMAALADSWTGIPVYEHGTPAASAAGRTSTGLGMLMTTAARGIKRVVMDVDKDIFKPLIERLYDYNMGTFPDEDIKGDMEVVATGAVAIMAKEQLADRRMAFLQSTNNPVDMRILGYTGRAKLLRSAASPLELAGESVIPDDDTVRETVAADEQAEAQARQAELDLKREEMQADIKLKQAELELKRLELDLKARELDQVKAPAAGAKLVESEQRADNDTLRAFSELANQRGES